MEKYCCLSNDEIAGQKGRAILGQLLYRATFLLNSVISTTPCRAFSHQVQTLGCHVMHINRQALMVNKWARYQGRDCHGTLMKCVDWGCYCNMSPGMLWSGIQQQRWKHVDLVRNHTTVGVPLQYDQFSQNGWAMGWLLWDQVWLMCHHCWCCDVW